MGIDEVDDEFLPMPQKRISIGAEAFRDRQAAWAKPNDRYLQLLSEHRGPDLCDAAHAAAESGHHRGEPAHQVGELLWAERLVAVAQRLLRLDVDIDQ